MTMLQNAYLIHILLNWSILLHITSHVYCFFVQLS